jgi:hypothetical protein
MHRMRDETRNGGRMEQPTLCSPDRICQGDSELRVVLQQLIEAHGIPGVKQVLRRIEAANQVETTRSRGRPPGPAIDDLPALQKAAAIWRQQGCGPVWPALTAVAKSLRGEPESNARRLLSRLQETGPGWTEKFVRAGIHDFSAASLRKFAIKRPSGCAARSAITRRGRRSISQSPPGFPSGPWRSVSESRATRYGGTARRT